MMMRKNWIVRAMGRMIFMGGMMMMTTGYGAESPYGPLNAAEKQVIVDRGTERPFTGKYDEHAALGVYACRNCGAALYRSDDKFDAGCGWPAFDDEIPGAVKRTADPDGRRIEITCAKCGAHLGHVFAGEKLTAKDTRHCVNSISLVFEPQEGGRLQRAVFAGGCFWGVEERMRRRPGVLAAVSGYAGGKTENPSYQQVGSGTTGHAEAVEVIYDPKKTDFETLCKYFLEIHDPTEKDRQGPDVGTQYRSAIFYLDEAQRKKAEELLDVLRAKKYDVATEVVPFRRFWNAEAYHQDYYERKGSEPYCHRYQKRF
jgi:peptide methionine sulfoxide reductase msrA/msrB